MERLWLDHQLPNELEWKLHVRYRHRRSVRGAGPPAYLIGGNVTPYAGAITELHLGTANILFCDGHVKAVKVEQLGYCTSPYGSMVCPMLSIAADGSPA